MNRRSEPFSAGKGAATTPLTAAAKLQPKVAKQTKKRNPILWPETTEKAPVLKNPAQKKTANKG